MTRKRLGPIAIVSALAFLVVEAVSAMMPDELVREGHVRIRVRTDPAEQVVIGQQTRFFVEILTDTWFSEAPAYPELTIPGSIALMPESLGMNFTERIDGVTYSGQRRSYVIFPQRTGPLEIPSLPIRPHSHHHPFLKGVVCGFRHPPPPRN